MLQLVVESITHTRLNIIKDQAEHELLVRCQKGDLKAYKDVYNIYSTMLFSIAMRMLGTKEDAEDALQNCFTKLYKTMDQFRFQSKFSSYLVRILINCCYDLLAKRKKFYDSFDEKSQNIEQQHDWSLSLETAINVLPLKMRECFILFAVEGFKQNEIAEMLEVSEGTVKAHIFQAKTKLRQILK